MLMAWPVVVDRGYVCGGAPCGDGAPEVVAGCTCAGMVRECGRLACPVLMAGPWWWTVGMSAAGPLALADDVPEVVAGLTCAGIGSPAGGWWCLRVVVALLTSGGVLAGSHGGPVVVR